MTAIEGAGTPETVWQGWPALRSWPDLPLTRVPSRVVVVAPHPDDEILGVGGMLSRLTASGSEVVVVATTDGEASHPGSPTLRPADLIRLRAGERRAALRRLGLSAVRVVRLGLPDGCIAEAEDDLAVRLAHELESDSWCLAAWRQDGHPDHEASGRAAALAAARVGCRLLEFPVWTWHWAVPDDDRVPWSRARLVHLTPPLQARKKAAADEFHTQVADLSDHPADAAILPAHVLARLVRDIEVVFT